MTSVVNLQEQHKLQTHLLYSEGYALPSDSAQSMSIIVEGCLNNTHCVTLTLGEISTYSFITFAYIKQCMA